MSVDERNARYFVWAGRSLNEFIQSISFLEREGASLYNTCKEKCDIAKDFEFFSRQQTRRRSQSRRRKSYAQASTLRAANKNSTGTLQISDAGIVLEAERMRASYEARDILRNPYMDKLFLSGVMAFIRRCK